MTRGSVFKNDSEARALWGAAYGAIPKSVFAVACWHLTDRLADDGDRIGLMLEEIEALTMNRIITEGQAKASIKALKALLGEPA